MTYMIVEASTASKLEERVQRFQQQGWEPEGGVSVAPKCWRGDGAGTINVTGWRYTQGMVRLYLNRDYAPDPDEMEALLREGYETQTWEAAGVRTVVGEGFE